MTKYLSILAAALSLTLGCSCQTKPGSVAGAPKIAASGNGQIIAQSDRSSASAPTSSESREAQFRMARALLENGNHTGAIKHFAFLRDHAESADERDRAIIGLSMALQDSGNRGAALGALEPLPEIPRTGLEARKCVLAGEIHLHQKNASLARTWLSRGLEFEPTSEKRYRASGFFNLGKALLAEDNLNDARMAFHEAQEIFLLNGDEANAKQCDLIAADISRGLQ